ncbi:MAG: FAD-binding oxidoreductase [Flavobacteriaceae bacterium]|nr:FAD-binding oxidoreductase [Flavobacteriaceae bacterium]
MKVDYIIVGCSMAGICMSEVLESKGKSFIVFDDNSQNSSKVAGGVFNSVILKRFTPVWNGDTQLEKVIPFYRKLEDKLDCKLVYLFDTYRVLNSVEEQNNWAAASDKPVLNKYMQTEIITDKIDGINSEYGFGKLIKTGRIDTNILINKYRAYLSEKGQYLEESFDYSVLYSKEGLIKYKDIEATNIVFCEGYGLKNNPFFNYLPLNEVKGEVLTIKAPSLKVDKLIKAGVFVLPLGDDLYTVGATFDWKDKSQNTREQARTQLKEKLDKFLICPYEIVGQKAGIRPTTKDRRPFVGEHPQAKNMYILNGLGTRGVMIGPMVSEELYDLSENNIPLDKEIDIKRFL